MNKQESSTLLHTQSCKPENEQFHWDDWEQDVVVKKHELFEQVLFCPLLWQIVKLTCIKVQ